MTAREFNAFWIGVSAACAALMLAAGHVSIAVISAGAFLVNVGAYIATTSHRADT